MDQYASASTEQLAVCEAAVRSWKERVKAKIGTGAYGDKENIFSHLIALQTQLLVGVTERSMQQNVYLTKGKDWENLRSLMAQGEVSEADFEKWKSAVTEKLQRGFYVGGRRDFYRHFLARTPKVSHLKESFASFDQLPAEKKSFWKAFTSEEFAQEHVEDKIAFLEEELLQQHDPEKAKRLEKWKGRSNRLRQAKGLPALRYPKNGADIPNSEKVHGISSLKKLGLTGKGVVVGVIEPSGSLESDEVHRDIRNRLTPESKAPVEGSGASHGATVVSLISSEPRTVFDETSVAPGSKIHFEFSSARIGSVRLKVRNPDRTVLSCFAKNMKDCLNQLEAHKIQPGAFWVSSEVEVTYPDKTASLLEAFEAMSNPSLEAVNLSQTLWIEKTADWTHFFLRFAADSKVVFKAIGNQSRTWLASSLEHEKVVDRNPQKVLELLSFHRFSDWILSPENKVVLDSFVFIGDLAPVGSVAESRLTLSPSSDRPGEALADRTLSVLGSSHDELHGEFSRARGAAGGTSFAAAIASGTFALLKEAFPHCTGAQIAHAMLDSASYEGLELSPQDGSLQWNGLSDAERREHLPAFRGAFGRGKLQAEGAYQLLSRQGCTH